MFKSLKKYSDFGLLILRAGLGLMFMIAHGWPKLSGGPERWTGVGSAMKILGIDFAPQIWGFMAGATEFFGGACLVIGLYMRPASIGLLFVMLIASLQTFARAGTFTGNNAHSVEIGIVLLGLLFIGAGKFSFDEKLGKN